MLMRGSIVIIPFIWCICPFLSGCEQLCSDKLIAWSPQHKWMQDGPPAMIFNGSAGWYAHNNRLTSPQSVTWCSVRPISQMEVHTCPAQHWLLNRFQCSSSTSTTFLTQQRFEGYADSYPCCKLPRRSAKLAMRLTPALRVTIVFDIHYRTHAYCLSLTE